MKTIVLRRLWLMIMPQNIDFLKTGKSFLRNNMTQEIMQGGSV